MSVAHEFTMIPLGAIYESRHNPRRHFDEAALEELADSIRKVGILTPLLVRPRKQGGVEIAAGHRRYRAAKLIPLGELPCLVRELEDQDFLEILTIENLQREDVHALDEAKGYEALMAAPYKMDVHRIAERVGRSVKYIYDRVKLLQLTKEAQDLFLNGMITAGHAIILARLSPADQQRCMEDRRDGLWRQELGLYDPTKDEDEDYEKPCSVRELQAWVDRRVRFNPATADAMLFPDTVKEIQTAQVAKAKIIPITYQYLVHEDVRNHERVYSERSWKRADGRHDSKACELAVLGVVVSGPHRGEAFDVCVQKKTCLVHWKEEVKAAEKRAKGQGCSADAKARQDQDRKEQQAAQACREEQDRQRKAWEQAVPKIKALVTERVKACSNPHGLFGDLLVEALSGYRRKRQTSVPRGKTSDELVRHLAALALDSRIEDWDAHDTFPTIAKSLGVDLSPILAPKKPVPVQTSARKPAKKRKAA